jgi:chemotaxis protein CheC
MLAARSHTDIDPLREVASIGCGGAVAALGRLTSRRASMEVPEARFTSSAEDLADLLAPLGSALFAVGVDMEGLLGGHLALVVPEADAHGLAALLLGQDAPAREWDPLSESAVLEAGNIAGSAFVSAVGRLTGATLLLSVPRLARGSGAAVLETLVGDLSASVALATRFTLRAGGRDEGVSGLIVAVPDVARLPELLAALPGP